MSIGPKVYNWVGGKCDTLYWDDPKNWAEGKYPNEKEAVAVFDNSTQQDTTILIRKDIHLAQIWLNEKKSLTFAHEFAQDDPAAPKFYLETTNQLSMLYVNENNISDHTFAIWILHSCYWNGTSRSIASPRLGDDKINTIHYRGRISNYKDPDRASLQVYGNMAIQLDCQNDFRGPVIAKRNGRIRVSANGAIPDGTPITVDEGAELYIADDVVVQASELRLNGVMIEPGTYSASELKDQYLLGKEISFPDARVTGSGSVVVG